MQLFKTYLILSLLFLFSEIIQAQPFHFSQFHAVPLVLNPALTGDFDDNYRLSGSYRSQWVNGGTPYLTGSICAELHILKDKMSEGNKIGIGLNILTDKSNGGGLQYNAVSASFAYHHAIDNNGYQTLGLGFQGTYHQQSINLSKLNFEEQFVTNGFDNTLPTGEVFNSLNKSYIDMNVGMLYNYSTPDNGVTLFAGAAIFNLLQPNISLTDKINYQLPLRFTSHLGGKIPIGEQSDLKFSATYMQMAKASDCTIGAAYDYTFDPEKGTGLLFGGWYRIGDAAIPYIGLRNRGFQLGFTYDVTTSSIKTLSQTHNAFEISLQFSPFSSAYKNDGNWY